MSLRCGVWITCWRGDEVIANHWCPMALIAILMYWGRGNETLVWQPQWFNLDRRKFQRGEPLRYEYEFDLEQG